MDHAVITFQASFALFHIDPVYTAAKQVGIYNADILTCVKMQDISDAGARIRMPDRNIGDHDLLAVFIIQYRSIPRIRKQFRLCGILVSAFDDKTVRIRDHQFQTVIYIPDLYIIMLAVPGLTFRTPDILQIITEIICPRLQLDPCSRSDRFHEIFHVIYLYPRIARFRGCFRIFRRCGCRLRLFSRFGILRCFAVRSPAAAALRLFTTGRQNRRR